MRRDRVFQIRVSDKEKAVLDKAAERAELKPSAWGREVLLNRASEPYENDPSTPPEPAANGEVAKLEDLFK